MSWRLRWLCGSRALQLSSWLGRIRHYVLIRHFYDSFTSRISVIFIFVFVFIFVIGFIFNSILFYFILFYFYFLVGSQQYIFHCTRIRGDFVINFSYYIILIPTNCHFTQYLLISHKTFIHIFAAISDLFYSVQERSTTGESTHHFGKKPDCLESNTDTKHKVSIMNPHHYGDNHCTFFLFSDFSLKDFFNLLSLSNYRGCNWSVERVDSH